MPVGTVRTWSGKDYVKHADGWVAVHSGRLTAGKDMKEVEGHHNAEDHANHVKTHASKKNHLSQSLMKNLMRSN